MSHIPCKYINDHTITHTFLLLLFKEQDINTSYIFFTITSDFCSCQLCIVKGFSAHKTSPGQLAPGDNMLLFFTPSLCVFVYYKVACLPIFSGVFLGSKLYEGYAHLSRTLQEPQERRVAF